MTSSPQSECTTTGPCPLRSLSPTPQPSTPPDPKACPTTKTTVPPRGVTNPAPGRVHLSLQHMEQASRVAHTSLTVGRRPRSGRAQRAPNLLFPLPPCLCDRQTPMEPSNPCSGITCPWATSVFLTSLYCLFQFPEKIRDIQSKLTSQQQASLQNKYVPCNTQNSLHEPQAHSHHAGALGPGVVGAPGSEVPGGLDQGLGVPDPPPGQLSLPDKMQQDREHLGHDGLRCTFARVLRTTRSLGFHVRKTRIQ